MAGSDPVDPEMVRNVNPSCGSHPPLARYGAGREAKESKGTSRVEYSPVS